jgi:hypothetical protein
VGNYDAIVTVHIVRRILQNIGIKPERLALDWASAAEAPLYVNLITEYTNRIKELGPLKEADGLDPEKMKWKLAAAKATVKSVKLRTRLGKLARTLRQENDYSLDTINARMREKVDDAILSEMEKQVSAFRVESG